MTTRDRHEEVARRYMRDVLTLENVDAVEEIFAHPDEWDGENPEYASVGRVSNYDDLKTFYRRELGKVEDRSVEVHSVVADGDEVLVRWTARGRVSEEFFGIPSAPRAHEAERIVDVNPAVVATFDRDREAMLGEPVAVLLGSDDPAPDQGELIEVTGPNDRRYFEVVASPLTGADGDRIGRTLAFHEITQRRRRVQQLEVLNRVLRHNLRNDLTAVRGGVEVARDRTDDDEVTDALARTIETTEQLLATAETAREVQTALQDTAVREQDLAAVVARVCERAREASPTATVTLEAPDALTVEATTALESGLWELVDNACEHAGKAPAVAVDVSVHDETAVVTVADDGPGLPAQERRVLEAGEETPLAHGSGLGLWLAHWVVEAAGGDLSFDVADGTTVRATVPLAARQ